ncbi:MAG: hypothetical protein LQ338_001581 [Usnochroma carphineum]|nr:MAG: hypothetical protein LQ338_001581 [Usnochroma carphineum]
MAQCRECLKKNGSYPTDLSLTPVAAMSTAYCSPADGRTDTKTIDGWIDDATYGADIHLEPITTVPNNNVAAPTPSPLTGPNGAVQTDISESAFDSIVGADTSGPFTGLGGAASTVIGTSVFASLESAAATETAMVSALGQSSTTATTGQTSVTTSMMGASSPATSSTTGGTSVASQTSPVGGTTSSTVGSSSPTAVASPSSTSDASGLVAFQLWHYLLLSFLIAVLHL